MPVKRQAMPFVQEVAKSPRPTFDLTMADEFFPAIVNSSDQVSELTAAVLKRHAELIPSSEERIHITTLVAEIQTVIDSLALNPESLPNNPVEDSRVVGSMRRGTMIRGKNEADVVVILRSAPTAEILSQMCQRMSEELKKTEADKNPVLQVTDYGILVQDEEKRASVRVLLAATPLTEKFDTKSAINANVMNRHLSAVRHVRWFEDCVTSGVHRALIRVIKDIVDRYPGLQVMNRWAIDVMAHYSIAFTRSEQPLSLSQALKRFFRLLSGGMFLSGSAGIPDPCENGVLTLHSCMTQKQQDRLCLSAQTIIRVLSLRPGFDVVLGLATDAFNILENESQWDGAVIRPHGMVIGSEDHENKSQSADEMDMHFSELMSGHTEDQSDLMTFFND